jgi:hypothetical protein
MSLRCKVRRSYFKQIKDVWRASRASIVGCISVLCESAGGITGMYKVLCEFLGGMYLSFL